jgi:hypothetical protein
MDTVEDLEEGDGDSVLEEALRPGLMLAWEEEDCRDVATSSAELRECLSHQLIPLTAALGLCLIMEKCRMVMLEHLWEQIPMLRR